ncbi:MAG TPA: hypothetical protein VNO32_06030 [Candidatus Acidoferrum sp.]|nr:hypothetical protein [Candidatus Acidoferrum sp.]
MDKRYIDQPVGRAELSSLAALATVEETKFFARNPHLVESYGGRLIAAALCQGAALQYLGRGYGVNDFDIYFFYSQNPAKLRLLRAVKGIRAAVGAFDNIRVDFIRTVVPPDPRKGDLKKVETLRAFLKESPTANAAYLAQKAVVGILPDNLFGLVIWECPVELGSTG